MQESNSLRHQAVEAQQGTAQEVSSLQQQLSDLQDRVVQPLQAEHRAMLAALSTVTQLCAEQAPTESPQLADRAHLMAPSVHHADGSISPGSANGSPYSPRLNIPSDAPMAELSTLVDAREAAKAAVSAVQHCLSQAQGQRAALLEAKQLAEVGDLAVYQPVSTPDPAATNDMTLRQPTVHFQNPLFLSCTLLKAAAAD